MDTMSDRNPDLEEMRERGWAWVLRSNITGKYGAPTTDDRWAAHTVTREHGDDELLIVSFEE